MEVAAIGIGNGGCKVVDSFIEVSGETGVEVISDAFALNTAESDLSVVNEIPASKQLLLTSPEMRASGTGNKPELGAELMEQNLTVVKNALASIPHHSTDALLVVAALGGGTGSGGAPVLANELRTWYDIPVFGLGILPSEHGHLEFNAARSFMDFGKTTDNLFVVDNARYLSSSDSIQESYRRINRDIAQKWLTFLNAGEQSEDGAEMYVDAADLFAVLEMGGISVLGFASEAAGSADSGGLIERFRTNGSQIDHNVRTRKLVDTVKAATRNLTMEADLETAEGVSLLVSGPPAALTQQGIEQSRQYLQDLTGAQRVSHGDDPRAGSEELSAAVLFSNVGSAHRVDELKQRGKNAKREIERRRQERAAKRRDMFSDPDDELGSLFDPQEGVGSGHRS
ncbi:tubulin/FtsZ family protein [Halolamina litorea]|uniref:Tubulin-like protein CetZ n=1 Tax=Halolamina litorea TaxID=1515593 RepID=A0ABD6BVD7_9EURY|nr:cell division protein [Halolamina litorea]